jgi:hypothetical protein
MGANWFPHYEAIHIVTADLSLHRAMLRSTALALQGAPLRELPRNALGYFDAPQLHLRPRAPRTAQVSAMELQEYRGLLVKGGVNFGT